jgi:hypothetical protein
MSWDTIHKVVTEVTGVFTSGTLLVIHGEETLERLLVWSGAKQFITRTHGERRKLFMGLAQDVKLAITFVPQLEKIAADAKAIEGNPQAQQLVTDVQALIAMIKAAA